MTEARAFLVAALSRVANGDDIDNEELDAAVPNPMVLSKEERLAWEELSHWADDDDVRAKDIRYAAYKRDRMRDCLATLSTSSS